MIFQRVSSGTLSSNAYFDCYNHPADFCTDADLDSNIRMRVLKLRSDNVPEFKGLNMIPAVESQILRKTLEVILFC